MLNSRQKRKTENFATLPFDITQYSIFHMDGDTTFLGNEAVGRDGTSPQSRPDALETRRPMQRL